MSRHAMDRTRAPHEVWLLLCGVMGVALHHVSVGDTVLLLDSLGDTHGYEVQSRRSYPKTALPVDVLLPAAEPTSSPLVLVTCGGEVDRVTGHYEDNVVVVAVPVTADPSAATSARTTSVP